MFKVYDQDAYSSYINLICKLNIKWITPEAIKKFKEDFMLVVKNVDQRISNPTTLDSGGVQDCPALHDRQEVKAGV